MTTDTDDGNSAHGGKQRRLDTVDLTDDYDSATEAIDLTVSDGEDDDLKLAIALSLQDQHPIEPATSDRSSIREQTTEPQASEQSAHIEQAVQIQQHVVDKPQGLLPLDRKQMEEERLARLKRKRNAMADPRAVSPPPLRRNKLPVTQPVEATISVRSKMTPSQAQSDLTASAVPLARTDSRKPSPHPGYPDGKVFLTSLHDTQRQSISLPRLLKPTEPGTLLKSALLSTYIVDFDWLLPHFDTRHVSFVLALHAQNDQEKSLVQRDFADIPNVRVVFPHVGGVVNCMHTKIMLLFYENASRDPQKSRCRVVVPSANLIPGDWGVTAVMENILFVVDLPVANDQTARVEREENQFKSGLMQMLQSMTVPDDVMQKLGKYDFSRTMPYRFVHTVGGSHMFSAVAGIAGINTFFSTTSGGPGVPASVRKPTSPIRTGITCLSDAVRSLGLCVSPDDACFPPKLDFITSSLGNLKGHFLQSLFLAACGRAPEVSPKSSHRGKNKSKHDQARGYPLGSDLATIKDSMKIHFPSQDTVRDSKGGPALAGTICFQSKWWDGLDNEFPREMILDCVGARKDGILMHSKVLFVRFSRGKTADRAGVLPSEGSGLARSQDTGRDQESSLLAGKTYAGWVYLGSANLSESAWIIRRNNPSSIAATGRAVYYFPYP